MKFKYFVVISIFSILVSSLKISSETKSKAKTENKVESKTENKLQSKTEMKSELTNKSVMKEKKLDNFLVEKSRVDEKDKIPEKVPIINVHMEEPDRDPIEIKRIEEERRIERTRVREMETMEEMDKRTFQQIISVQNSQLSKLTSIADKTSDILSRLSNNLVNGGRQHPSAAPSFKQTELQSQLKKYNLQKKNYLSILDIKNRNGPIKLPNFNYN